MYLKARFTPTASAVGNGALGLPPRSALAGVRSRRRLVSEQNGKGKNMCSPKLWCVLLASFCIAPGPLALAQSAKPAGDLTPTSTSKVAVGDDIQQLRREVAELRAQVQRLLQASGQKEPSDARTAPANGAAANSAVPQEAGAPATATRADVDALQKEITALQKKASDVPPATAGWNGEHFFLRSTDGNFTLMPVGYFDAHYIFYHGDGAPNDTFSISRARFGFQGNYGKQLDYALMIETISSPTVRDAYLDFKPWKAFNIMAGQFRVPFSMEVGTGDTAVEFYNRSIISVLYPDAGGAFRAPGFDAHGELAGGRVEYWLGLFNGQGLLTSGTTNEPEVVGRLRFSPWKNSHIALLNGLAFGGSAEHSRSKGLANEQSFSGLVNDGTYTFFPQFRINGGVQRYNGFFSWLDGPLGIRGEYVHLQQDRANIGSLAAGGIGFNTLPAVKGEGYYVSATYFLTGEAEPVNALPRVRHPVIGPASPGESGTPGWGAWAVKFRYSRLQGGARGATCDASTIPACPITPAIVPTYADHTAQFTVGLNWYLNYWVLIKSDINLDQLKDPSVQGLLPRNYYSFFETLQFRF
jgi:phosphate-selective porin